MKKIPDVDIDVDSSIDRTIYGIRAINYDPSLQRINLHQSGVYFKDSGMAVDGETGNAAVDYKKAEELGFMKVDLLSNTVYDGFSNKREVLQVFAEEPDWSKLEDATYIGRMPHLYNHVDITIDMKPRSLEDLADLLALIRPGKKHLISSYLKDKEETRKELYRKTEEGVYFKKSHAYAYAAMLICFMNKKQSKHLVVF